MNIRDKMTLTYFLYVVGAVLGIICVIFECSFSVRITVAVIMTTAVICVLKQSCCPVCNKYGIRIRPFSKEKPICKKCGKQL